MTDRAALHPALSSPSLPEERRLDQQHLEIAEFEEVFEFGNQDVVEAGDAAEDEE